MKHKVSDLEGDLLDAAVAKAEGLRPFLIGSYMESGVTYWRTAPPPYSTEWGVGGPIIERERIMFLHDGIRDKNGEGGWISGVGDSDGRAKAFHYASEWGFWLRGSTPLIAAMRAYVASKFGEEIEL